MLKTFCSYYKPYLKTFAFDMFCSFCVSAIAMIYPIITRNMLNDFIPNKKYNMIVTFGIVLFVVYLVKMLMRYFVDYYGHMVGIRMQADMRRDIFNKIQKLPFKYFDDHETGKILTRCTNDIQEISELAHHGPEMLFMSLISLVFSFCYLASINFILTIIIFSCSPLLIVLNLIVRKYYMISARKARKAVSQINGDVNSSLSGIRVTKAFNNSDKELEKFSFGNNDLINAKTGQYKAMGLQHSVTGFVTDVFNVVCLLCGGIFLYKGGITFGDYSTFIVSINLFTSPVMQLIQWLEMFQDGISGFERFLEVMNEPIEEDKDGAKDYKKLNGDIIFDKVNFSYTSDEKQEVLKNVSFKVKKGQTLALVGPSGGGKTTICHLLPKFYHAHSGCISIDGKDIEDIKMKSLRENIGIVQQDVFLFSGSFYDNIAYGKLDASRNEIIAAAKKANIYDYIMSLPEGFDTNIGERGVRLSGGQKQRLAIARVFLKNPSILILDEATSALDNTTEILIQEALNKLKKGRTTIVVAHRLSTIKNADEIIVIANGEIKEKGKHSTLLKKRNGIYKKLYNAQFSDQRMMMS